VSPEKGSKAKSKTRTKEKDVSKGTTREQMRTSRSTTVPSSQGPSLLSKQKVRQGAGQEGGKPNARHMTRRGPGDGVMDKATRQRVTRYRKSYRHSHDDI
jgi:hypothetical protein